MFYAVYIIWGLLPLAFILLTIWGILKPLFKLHGKEHTREHFSHAVFCLFAFVVAIFVDQKFMLRYEGEAFFGFLNADVIHWLIFPAVLALLAQIQKTYKLTKNKPQPHRRFTGAGNMLEQ